jgi:hypothetical protein
MRIILIKEEYKITIKPLSVYINIVKVCETPNLINE